MDEQKQIVEINGVKIEVDLRTAKRIEAYRVGDRVKVLKKDYSDYKVHLGMIVDFVEFKELPTIVVAYLVTDPYSAKLSYAYLNSNSKDIEMAPMGNFEELPIEKSRIVDLMQREIEKKRLELEEAEHKLEFFVKRFSQLFDPSEQIQVQ